MERLIAAIRQALDAGVNARQISNDVVNIYRCGREVEEADVATVRRLVAEAGYQETKSWIAGEGVSWMSDGIPSVSFRITSL